jgi:hypothetical protein
MPFAKDHDAQENRRAARAKRLRELEREAEQLRAEERHEKQGPTQSPLQDMIATAHPTREHLARSLFPDDLESLTERIAEEEGLSLDEAREKAKAELAARRQQEKANEGWREAMDYQPDNKQPRPSPSRVVR